MQFLNSIISLGAAVIMPIIFLIVGLAVRLKLSQAVKAALLVGVGFTGLNMVINLLLDNLGPATHAMVNHLGVHLTVLDTGWGNSATIGWGSVLMPLTVFMFLILNLLLFAIKFTKTIDVDIFNYWIFLTCGSVIFAVTKNFAFSLLMMALLFTIILKIADWSAPVMQKEFKLDGVSFPHMNTAPWVFIGIAVNWIIEKIPGLNKVKINPETINKRFGILGDPLVIGFIIGALIGFLAEFSVPKVLSLAITVAAAMLLLPKMVDILMEGLTIIRTGVETVFKKRFPKRKIYIGMDVALMAGNASVIATGVLLIPIALLLAVILPGNKVLPLVDLPSLIFPITMVCAYCKKDMFRTLVAGIIILVLILYIGTNISVPYTAAAIMSHAKIPVGVSEITSLNSGATTILGWIAIELGRIFHIFF